MNPQRWAKLKAKAAREKQSKVKRKGTVQGNAEWKALSSTEPRGKPEPVKLRLTLLDVYKSNKI